MSYQDDSNRTDASTDLRSRAESIYREKSSSLDDVSGLSTEQLKSLFHELQVHQIELELQNQELLESQQELAKSRDAFIDLYDFAPMGYLTINDKGIIVQANLTVAKMFVADRGMLANKPLSNFVAHDDQRKYYLNMSHLNKNPNKTTWELRLKKPDNTFFEGELQVSPILDIDGNFQHQFKVIISDVTGARETRKALEESEQLFRSVFENSLDGILLSSPDGTIVRANPAACAILDRTEEDICRIGRKGVVDSRDSRLAGYFETRKTEGKFFGELQFFKKDGLATFPVEVASSLFLRPNGEERYVVTFRDITDRKKSEQELRESERRLRSYFEAPLIGVSITSPEKGVLDVNDMACQMLGYSKEELFGVSWAEMTHPDDMAENLQHFERLRTGEIDTFRMEKRFFRKDGEIIWVDLAVACVRNDDGSLKYNIAFLEDISKRVAAEKNLQASENRFRELVELLPQGIFETDTENRFTFANSSQKHISGVLLDEDIIGKFPTEFVDPIEHQKVFEHYEAVKKSLVYEQEYMGWEQNGVRRPDILVKVAAIKSDDKLVGFRGVVTDISLLKQAEREREALQERFFQAQKLISLGTLVRGIAHDFNNMLQVIIGYSELLMADIKQGGDDHKLLDNIVQTARKAADVVTKFMALGQQSMVETRLIDLNEKIRDVESLILSVPNITDLNIDLMDEHAIIKQNPDQLDQILMILATNASEAMPGGGLLSLSTTRIILSEDECSINIGVNPGPFILLTVTDTGRGMDKAVLSRIFDPFFSTKERCDIKGMGLGLSVLRGIVQQRGGFVTCESELGNGATFRVYFPEFQASTAPGMISTEPGTSMTSKAIFIIEDDIIVAELEKNACNRAGYPTILASNGRQALDVYRKRHTEIGLVILDILMPDMNGRDCLMELLKINPLVKVIVLSGHDPKSEMGLAVEPYVMSFLTKPCKMSQLVEVAQSLMKDEKIQRL